MKRFGIGLLILIAAFVGAATAQTTTQSTSAITPAVPSIAVTVTPVPVPATVTVTPSTATAKVGSTLTLNIAVTGSAPTEAVPTGTIALYVGPQGATASAMTKLTSYPLTGGKVTCSYVIPDSPGSYVVEPVYSGDSAYIAGTLP